MGEYYEFVNLDKKEYLTPGYFGSAINFSNCRQVDNDFINSAYTLMNSSWKNDTVLFLGDESSLKSNGNPVIEELINKYSECPMDECAYENGVNISRLFKATKEELTGSDAYYYNEDKELEENYLKRVYKALPFSKGFIFYRYIFNHTRKQYIDRNKLGDCGDIYYVDPFPALIGVGRHSEYDYPDFRKSYIGMWIGDDIEITNDPSFKDYEDMSHIEDKYTIRTPHGVYEGYSLEAIKKEFIAHGYKYDESQFKIGEYAFEDISADENTFYYEGSNKYLSSKPNQKDNEKYTYVSIFYEDAATDKIYSYSPGDYDVKVGDRVWVYRKDELVVGKIGAINQLTRYEAPCEPELLKEIQGFVDDDYVVKPYEEQVIDNMSPKERAFFNKWDVSPFQVMKHRKYNRDEIARSNKCCCYYCEKEFDAYEINEWVEADAKQTAICPYCGQPFVLGDASNLPIYDFDFIDDMCNDWL